MHAYITDRTMPEPNSGCVIWLGSCFPNGYGQAKWQGKGFGAHRLSWLLSCGPIPTDTPYVCHKCDVRLCCNPDHLFLGTAKDNSADRDAKGRQARQRGEAQGGHKITEEQAIAIINEPGPVTLLRAKEIGKSLGITSQHVYRIRLGSRWSHLRRAA